MVKGMDERFQRCVQEGKLVKGEIELDLVKKELDAAQSDLKIAEKSLSEHNFKWATIQAYYSMFHTAKALVLSKGYREKSHQCLSVALKALFVDSSLLKKNHFDHFRDCMNLRQDADYGLIYSETSAVGAVNWAEDFLEAGGAILSKS